MKTWNYKEASAQLTNLLNRQGLGKIAEDVSTIKDPETAQDNIGQEQQAAIEAAPAIAPVDSNVAPNTEMAEGITNENHVNGTDGSANTQEVGMKVETAQENASVKEASLGAAFARGLVNKTASVMNQAQESAPYMTGMEMFQKKAAMMTADADKVEAAANDFYSSLPALQANPCFQEAFRKCAAQKMAEDVAAAMEATGAAPEQEAEIAAALEQAVAEDPELAAELEGEITSDAIDELAAAEQDAAVIEELAAATGVEPEALIEAANLIDEAAAENGMTPDEFAATLEAAMTEEAPAEEPVPAEEPAPAEEAAPAAEEVPPMDVVKEASMRRLMKAASIARRNAQR